MPDDDWLPWNEMLGLSRKVDEAAIEAHTTDLIAVGKLSTKHKDDVVCGVVRAAEFYFLGQHLKRDIKEHGQIKEPLSDVAKNRDEAIKYIEQMIDAVRQSSRWFNDEHVSVLEKTLSEFRNASDPLVESAALFLDTLKFPNQGKPKQWGDRSFIWIMAIVCKRIGINPAIGRRPTDPKYRSPFQRFTDGWLIAIDPSRQENLPSTSFYQNVLKAQKNRL